MLSDKALKTYCSCALPWMHYLSDDKTSVRELFKYLNTGCGRMKLSTILTCVVLISRLDLSLTVGKDDLDEKSAWRSTKEDTTVLNTKVGITDSINEIKKESVVDSMAEVKQKAGKYRILAVFPYQGVSHHIFLHSILRILLNSGYHITNVSPVPMKENSTNLRQIVFKPSIVGWAELFEFEDVVTLTSSGQRVSLEMLSETFMYPLYECPEFRQLVRESNEHFDLVLLEPFFQQEALVFLRHRFNCPVIAISTTLPETFGTLFMGRLRNPAVECEQEMYLTSNDMNFFQRVSNTFDMMMNILEHRYYYVPKREYDLHRLLPYPGIESSPPIRQLLQEISLNFGNYHPLLYPPAPLTHNSIMIPGLHIRTQNLTIPKEFEVLLDSAKDGVILFSMGTMTPVSKMKQERDVFMQVFAKLPQLVLWKSDVDLKNLPSNVKTFRWIPQQAILGSGKCVLFITHGGMLSKQEAVYFGVPVLSIPLFGEQPSNAGHSQATGMGTALLYHQITHQTLYDSMTMVLNNNQYKKRMSEYSKIFRDSVKRSESEVLRWTEHVIETKGAKYLRRETNLYWFQYYLLDIFALFLLAIITILTILIKCAQMLCRIRFPAVQSQVKLKKK